MHTLDAWVELFVKFDDNLVGEAHPSRSVTKSCAEDYLSVVGNRSSFDDGTVHLAESAIAEFLGKFREVKVEIVHLVIVDVLAKLRGVLVWSAAVDGLSARKFAVNTVAGRSTGEDAYFEFATCFVFAACFGSNSAGNYLRNT